MSHHPHHALPTTSTSSSCPCKPRGHLGETHDPPAALLGCRGAAQGPSQPSPLTVVVTPEGLVLGDVGVQVTELPQVPDAVAEGADGQVLGREGLDVFHLAGA